jgi:hypothetical protein
VAAGARLADHPASSAAIVVGSNPAHHTVMTRAISGQE